MKFDVALLDALIKHSDANGAATVLLTEGRGGCIRDGVLVQLIHENDAQCENKAYHHEQLVQPLICFRCIEKIRGLTGVIHLSLPPFGIVSNHSRLARRINFWCDYRRDEVGRTTLDGAQSVQCTEYYCRSTGSGLLESHRKEGAG